MTLGFDPVGSTPEEFARRTRPRGPIGWRGLTVNSLLSCVMMRVRVLERYLQHAQGLAQLASLAHTGTAPIIALAQAAAVRSTPENQVQ